MQVLFTFAFQTETKEANFAGNVDIETALSILLKMAIADGIQKALNVEIRTEGAKAPIKEKDNA